ncbi:uncharacterized protein LOC6731988 [Drosophila simulans]|uniref:GD22169 n=1 Tax=Drosophila simulans TaxID=7240 RepID=B4Q376_DROSI|nr:uncharacterized protein LOC6731988 [Drosophila simulans]EDX04707.1 GD22169 [Drosophila simulans]KMY89765.1 uncharacterized protein Dsimw501_GD22169 [Drosophila simulans]
MILYRMRQRGGLMAVLLVVALITVNGNEMDDDMFLDCISLWNFAPPSFPRWCKPDTSSNIYRRPNNRKPKSQFRSGKGLGFNDHQDDSGSPGAIDTGSRTSVVSTEEPQVKTYSETSFVEVEEHRHLTVYAPNMAQQIIGNIGLISGMVILVGFFLEHCAFCK